ncbi:MAG: hydantoinase/oxoprolinase family protein [Rhodospirillales bacterium]
MTLRIALDVGGTFTDGVLLEESSGRIWLGKSLTTHGDPGIAIAKVTQDLLAAHGQAAAVGQVVHGTTLITNTLLERKGVRTALVTNRGLADALDIRRELRYDTYDLALRFPDPLAAREDRYEVAARSGPDGRVWREPDPAGIAEIAAALAQSGVAALAICLLHAPVAPDQEREIAALLAARLPDLPISLSAEVAGEIGEYERMSTTVANAYVLPIVQGYLAKLTERFGALGISARLDIMLSNGGFTTVEQAARFPIRLLESGPAGGVLSAINCGAGQGATRVLAFDMGGTTAKACVAVEGQPDITHVFEFARERRFKKGSGLPAVAASIDLIEIGAGGGSIARCGPLGLLKVGPESAGSEPGPACYGRGGQAASVTDADLLLGYLDPAGFLGGRMQLDVALARQALESLGGEVGLDAVQTAWGVHNIVNETMASAARTHIAEKGLDARAFVMVATGGAGPVHAVDVARRLRIGRILCPVASGVGSCLGFLAAPARADRAWSRVELLADLEEAFRQERTAQALREIAAELEDGGVTADRIVWQAEAEIRYRGQGARVRVPFDPRESPAPAALAEAFLEAYAADFGRVVPGGQPEVVTWRIWGTAGGGTRHFRLGAVPTVPAGETSERPIYLPGPGTFAKVPVYRRESLAPGSALRGPCVVCEAESTLVVSHPAEVAVLEDGTIEVRLEALSP